ncbi:EAL domain-containing protein [Aquipuribacter sp. MA13-6]|uniref:EAL domain-containing protein n=2 Tax=unclassified Aquipuribacter TaxID=2635084 RepID=UPI003EED290D
MYRAKRRGRSRTEVFAGQLRARADRRAQVEAQLEASLDDGSLQLFRQPVVSLVDGTEVGSEALARWFPAEGEIRPAESFLDQVTHSRVRRAVTDAILLCAVTALAREDRVVGVNVSLPDLRGAALVEDVADVLRRTGCPPGRLSLELGEALVCQATPLVRRTLAGLHGLGVRLVIDHVTGQVPVSTLAALPVQGVKLDREMLVTGEDQDDRGPDARTAVLHSLVTLTGDLGLELSAVGVETAVQQRWLVANGVTRGQGWRLGPPAPWVTVRRGGTPGGRPEATTRRFAVAPMSD